MTKFAPHLVYNYAHKDKTKSRAFFFSYHAFRCFSEELSKTGEDCESFLSKWSWHTRNLTNSGLDNEFSSLIQSFPGTNQMALPIRMDPLGFAHPSIICTW